MNTKTKKEIASKNIRVWESVYKDIKKIAKKEQLSLSEVVQVLLESYQSE